jgi:hypothetical protein
MSGAKLPFAARGRTLNASFLTPFWSLKIGLVTLATVLRLASVGAHRRAFLLVAATACAPLLAGIYVVPAMAYRDLTHMADMIVGFYRAQDHWVAFRTLFRKSTPLFLRNFLMVGPLLPVAAGAFAAGLALDFERGRRAFG